MDRRRHAPAAERNRGPILDVLARVLPARGEILEIASGTGQHVAFFAAALPSLVWQPSERDPDAFASIAAWCTAERVANVRAPLRIDVTEEPWPVGRVAGVFSANLIHIASWDVALALLRGAGHHLDPGGVLVLYGPYRIDGEHTAPSNAAFDLDLRERNAAWGVRDLEAVVAAAHTQGLDLVERVPMPANNQTLVFSRRSPPEVRSSTGRPV